MKAEDLMIGDWVTFQGVPQQVTYLNLDDGERVGTTEQYFAQITECFEPIPLTPELLEKNGIKKDINGRLFGEYFEEDKDYSLEISMRKDGIYWSINYDEYRILKLEYVHELQHALKLCGIEKEIEL